MEAFFEVRLSYYDKRKDYLSRLLHDELEKLDNKVRFILAVVHGELVISNRKKTELLQELKRAGYKMFAVTKKPLEAGAEGSGADTDDEGADAASSELDKGYDYLLSMRISSLTLERVQSLTAERDAKRAEKKELEGKRPEDLWLRDLVAFEVALDDFERSIDEGKAQEKVAQRRAGKAAQGKSGKPGVKKAKKPMAAGGSDDDDDDEESDFEDKPKKKAPAAKKPVAVKPPSAAVSSKPVVATSSKPVAAAVPKPVIAAVNGVAAGAGANIALACDIVVANSSASFIQAFSKIGLIPDSGGTYTLPRLIGFQRASALMMLGDKISAQEALQMGMLYKVYDNENFLGESTSLANTLAAMPTKALAYIKHALNHSYLNSMEDQLDLEDRFQQKAAATYDFKEGATAFLEKRLPIFKGE